MPQEYFDNLVPDYKQEIPEVSEKSLETMRRLLYMFKLAVNGHAMVLYDAVSTDVIAISPEFEEVFGWTLAEFQEVTSEQFFHEDSLPVVLIHGEHELAAPYIARCNTKGGGDDLYRIQGLTVEFDGNRWRMLSLDRIEED